MNFYINQTITINMLKVEGVSNSSVLQIGSAGAIKALSNLYNTGGFTEPAPEADPDPDIVPPIPGTVIPLAPLAPPM